MPAPCRPTADELLGRIRVQGGVPRHVAIIMDGNGRWARERFMPRPYGHRSGMKAVREVVEGAVEVGPRSALAVRVLAGELAAAARRDHRADVAARGVHCGRSR